MNKVDRRCNSFLSFLYKDYYHKWQDLQSSALQGQLLRSVMAWIEQSPGLIMQFQSELFTGVLALMLWIQTLDAQNCTGLSTNFYDKSCPEAE